MMVGTRCGRRWRNRIRERTGAERARRLDIFAFRQPHRLGIDHPGDLHPVHQGDHDDDDGKAGLEDGGERDGEQERRKGHHQVGEAHDRGPRRAPQISRGNPQKTADHHRDPIGENADQQRGAGAVEQPRELVAPIGVGAEPEALAGGKRRALQRQAVEELLIGIVRGDRRGEQAERQQHQNHAKTDHRQPVATEAPPEILHAELPIRDDLQYD